jgi:hypothetical protein
MTLAVLLGCPRIRRSTAHAIAHSLRSRRTALDPTRPHKGSYHGHKHRIEYAARPSEQAIKNERSTCRLDGEGGCRNPSRGEDETRRRNTNTIPNAALWRFRPLLCPSPSLFGRTGQGKCPQLLNEICLKPASRLGMLFISVLDFAASASRRR